MSIKPKIYRDLSSAKVHFGSKFGNPILDSWWMMARTISKYGNFLLLGWIWPWSSRSITPQNNRDLNQGVLLFWSKFGDSSLNGWQVIARTSKWLPHTQTHRQTDAANDNTRRSKLASGKNWSREKFWRKWLFGGDSSHITHYMTFKQIFVYKHSVNYVLLLFTKEEKLPLVHRFPQIWNLSLFQSRNCFCWRVPTSIHVEWLFLQWVLFLSLTTFTCFGQFNIWL